MRIKKTLIALIFLTVAHPGGVQRFLVEAAILKTLNGRVSEVDTRDNLLRVDFRHPVTGEHQEMVFAVSVKTGFSGVKALGKLRHDDPVKIDYEESPHGSLEARHIAKVRLEGPPVDVENFRGF